MYITEVAYLKILAIQITLHSYDEYDFSYISRISCFHFFQKILYVNYIFRMDIIILCITVCKFNFFAILIYELN